MLTFPRALAILCCATIALGASFDAHSARGGGKGRTAKANSPPTIAGTPAPTVVAGSFYRFVPTARDADGDRLTFSVQNRPAWASFDYGTGTLSGTPTAAAVGTFANIVIRVSDGQDAVSLPAFSITVLAAAINTAPQISGSPPTAVTQDALYRFQPAASDADGDPLTFTIANRPSWATFSLSTGALSGTPNAADVGVYANIVIGVSDGKVATSLPAFSITVNPVVANTPPAISGVPATSVLQGSSYRFVPSAVDADGDALTFSVTNLPPWATFDRATGTLSGTPGASAVGTYSNIVIAVSDGKSASSLQPFSIAVQSYSVGSATLSWTPPTQNVDGSPLTGLAGYKLYWGQAPKTYSQSVTIANPGITTYVLENLASGTYYFSVTAFTMDGTESSYSMEAAKAVP